MRPILRHFLQDEGGGVQKKRNKLGLFQHVAENARFFRLF
jgi:hypothetical protein